MTQLKLYEPPVDDGDDDDDPDEQPVPRTGGCPSELACLRVVAYSAALAGLSVFSYLLAEALAD